jgi:hypothetical protein
LRADVIEDSIWIIRAIGDEKYALDLAKRVPGAPDCFKRLSKGSDAA